MVIRPAFHQFPTYAFLPPSTIVSSLDRGRALYLQAGSKSTTIDLPIPPVQVGATMKEAYIDAWGDYYKPRDEEAMQQMRRLPAPAYRPIVHTIHAAQTLLAVVRADLDPRPLRSGDSNRIIRHTFSVKQP